MFDSEQSKAQYLKQINLARKRVEAVDQLPAELRAVLNFSSTSFDAEWILNLYRQGWPIYALIDAVRAQERARPFERDLRMTATEIKRNIEAWLQAAGPGQKQRTSR